MSKQNIKIFKDSSGNTGISFDFFLTEDDENALDEWFECLRIAEQERIINILKTIRVDDDFIGKDYAIDLIRGDVR